MSCALEFIKVNGAAAVAVDAAHNQCLVRVGENNAKSLQSLRMRVSGRSSTVQLCNLLQLFMIKSTRVVLIELIEHLAVLVAPVRVFNLLKAFLSRHLAAGA